MEPFRTVWPDVGIKSGQIVPKMYEKVATAGFTWRVICIKINQNIIKYLGHFCKKFVAKNFNKIAQSGRTFSEFDRVVHLLPLESFLLQPLRLPGTDDVKPFSRHWRTALKFVNSFEPSTNLHYLGPTYQFKLLTCLCTSTTDDWLPTSFYEHTHSNWKLLPLTSAT